MEASPGLLGPGGEWHPCPVCQHGATASRIVREQYWEAHQAWQQRHHPGYGFPVRQSDFLGSLGWLRVSDEGVVTDPVWDTDIHPTQAQLDVLWDLLMDAATTAPELEQGLRESMERLLEVHA